MPCRDVTCRRAAAIAAGSLLFSLSAPAARAGDSFDLTPPAWMPADASAPAAAAGADAPVDTDPLTDYFAAWSDRIAHVRATQPGWSSPLVTTTGLLEQRVRFDLAREQSGNGTGTTVLDNGKGVDLIVSDSNQVQIAAPPYYVRSGASTTTKGGQPIEPLAGLADWPFLRIEQRLASSPESERDYVLTAWLQIVAPSGIARLTGGAWQFLPTFAFGKGWGRFDVQGTLGAVLPVAQVNAIGHQVQTNIAFQYHVPPVFWPEVEVNSTYYADGVRGGLNQIYLTPGLVVGRFALGERLQLTLGAGYQVALTPPYRAAPLTPAYNHAWLVSSRLNF